MNRRHTRERNIGAALLWIARRLLDEPDVESFVTPVIADLQYELRQAGAGLSARVSARWRGYVAFWRVIMMTPIAAFDRPLEDRVITTMFGRQRLGPLVWLMVPLCAALWPLLAWFGIATVVAGVAAAVAIRRWNDRHPSTVPARAVADSRHVEINLAAIHVEGNAGGMFFAVGSMAIVFAGLPEMRLLLLVPIVGGALLAAAIFAWRTSHPSPLTCRNSLIAR